MPEIIAAHRIPYMATASIVYPQDLIRQVRKAKNTQGFRFLRLLVSPPSGLRFSHNQTVTMARLAVETRVFELYELTHGAACALSPNPQLLPVTEYIRAQRRFYYLSDQEILDLQKEVDQSWNQLLRKSFHL